MDSLHESEVASTSDVGSSEKEGSKSDVLEETKQDAEELEEDDIGTSPRIREKSYKKKKKEDLLKLVNKVKSLTTLCDLALEDFNEDVIDVIEEFFLDELASVLTIFYDEQYLKARLGFPDIEVDDLMYFVKQLHLTEPITPETFDETVIFGNVDCLADASILTTLETVFAPIFVYINNWPDGVKADFCFFLNGFLNRLTDLRYKMAGLTAIYIPKTASNKTMKEISKDKRLIKSFESNIGFYFYF
uniref:Uncharacterized protein n=1 Tax=Clastoptera arizonana TaxID=38151 RepID=A0A1B6D8H2_9HEMI